MVAWEKQASSDRDRQQARENDLETKCVWRKNKKSVSKQNSNCELKENVDHTVIFCHLTHWNFLSTRTLNLLATQNKNLSKEKKFSQLDFVSTQCRKKFWVYTQSDYALRIRTVQGGGEVVRQRWWRIGYIVSRLNRFEAESVGFEYLYIYIDVYIYI